MENHHLLLKLLQKVCNLLSFIIKEVNIFLFLRLKFKLCVAQQIYIKI